MKVVSCRCAHALSFPFLIFTDASEYQLETVIMQNDLPVAYYSRKLSFPRNFFAIIDKALISILEAFKVFRSMVLNAVLHVHTDHRNFIYYTLHTQRVLQWRLHIEEYLFTFHDVKDSLSRLPRLESLLGGWYWAEMFSINIHFYFLNWIRWWTSVYLFPQAYNLGRHYSISSGL